MDQESMNEVLGMMAYNSKAKKSPLFPKRPWWTDLSFWSLLLANVFVLGLTLWQHIPLAIVLLTFWSQSVIIGFFNFVRIVCMNNFSATSYATGTPQVKIQKTRLREKWLLAGLFAVHYGFFHVLYFIFLILYYHTYAANVSLLPLCIFAAVFFLNHLFSFLYNYRELTDYGDAGLIFFSPYIRIVPMHLTVMLFVFFGELMLVPFMIIKAAVDLFGHVVKKSGDLSTTPKINNLLSGKG